MSHRTLSKTNMNDMTYTSETSVPSKKKAQSDPNDLSSFLRRKRFLPQHDKFNSLMKVFKDNLHTSKYVDSKRLGDGLKVNYGILDSLSSRKRIKNILESRNKNEILKQRIEDRMKEVHEVTLRSEGASMPFEVREVRRRYEDYVKKMRISVIDKLLKEESTPEGLVDDGRTKLDSFIDDQNVKLERERLLTLIAQNETKLLTQDQAEMEIAKDDEEKRAREHKEEIDIRQTFVDDFEVSIKQMMRNINGGSFYK